MIRPSPRVSHAGSYESSAEAYTNSRDPIDDSDSVAEVLDQDSIPDVFKAKKKVCSSHIWLPENGIEWLLTELISENASVVGCITGSDF